MSLFTLAERPDLTDKADSLDSVSMDIERDLGTYVEPNVWTVHKV